MSGGVEDWCDKIADYCQGTKDNVKLLQDIVRGREPVAGWLREIEVNAEMIDAFAGGIKKGIERIYELSLEKSANYQKEIRVLEQRVKLLEDALGDRQIVIYPDSEADTP